MNNLIMLSTKADRNKPKPKDLNAPRDNKAEQRGASMQSRYGKETKMQFTCFFRGANGETGGKAQN